ncbi:MAG: FGGY-family carbohydrate kinase [Treponemataceae bacterium]|nr:FGGY-family carbohydrate kinase [Treponemataceae bacterium]
MQGQGAFLCVDIGTSSLKAAYIATNGTVLAFCRERYASHRVMEGTVQASDWEDAFVRACHELAEQSSPLPLIRGIAISGNGPTLVPITKDGRALAPLHWYQEKKTDKKHPGTHTTREEGIPKTDTGLGLVKGPKIPSHESIAFSPATVASVSTERAAPSLFLPAVRRFSWEHPADFARVAFFLSPQEYLLWRLGADPVTAIPNERYIPYYWDGAQLEQAGLSSSLFPPFVTMGTIVGRLSEEAAGHCLLPAGIPLIVGGPDFIMALLGVGVLEEGMVCDRSGTSEGINLCTAHPLHSARLRLLPHIRTDRWNVAALLPATGRLFEWFREITGQQERDYQEMMQEILETPAPKSFFFPEIHGEGTLCLPSAIISTAGLTSRAELGYAVVEAIGCMVRRGIELLEVHHFRIESMRLSGGQAKNPLWNQMKANITGRYLVVPAIEDGELAGNACLALIASGEATTLEEAVERMVHIQRVYEPVQAEYARFSERYETYRHLQSRMEQFF